MKKDTLDMSNMTGIRKKNVVRLGLWIDPSFDKILLSNPDIDLEVLKLDAPEEEGWKKLMDADIYHVSAARDDVPGTWMVTEELIGRCPRLACVSTSGAGYDTVDVPACTKAGILVVNQSGGNANSVAEHALGLMLSVSRRIPESHDILRSGERVKREELMGRELKGKVLGLVGCGHIGTRTAQLASVFGMRVLAHDPYLDADAVTRRGAEPVSMDELLAASDFVSVHCPRNSETLDMFNAREFQKMKSGAIFISTARGGIHNEEALYDAIASGHLGGAGLDVWRVEPPAADHPLLGLPNVVATYHTAGVTHEARKNIATISAEQILAICSGSEPERMVNKEAYARCVAKLSAKSQ